MITHRWKISVMGGRDVGKTSLIVRYIMDEFIENIYKCDDTYRELIKYRGEYAYLDIVDAYNHFFQSCNDILLRQCNHLLLIYSITSIESFETVKEIYNRIVKIKGEYDDQIEMNVILVGNKCDLLSKYKYIDPIDKLEPESIIILVYGYIHRNEKELIIRFIPEDIKKLCLSYVGKSSTDNRIEVTSEMGRKLAASWESDLFEVPFIKPFQLRQSRF